MWAKYCIVNKILLSSLFLLFFFNVQMSFLLTTLEKQVEEKGKELVEYREKYNIKLQNEAPGDSSSDNSREKAAQGDSKSSGVLVTSWATSLSMLGTFCASRYEHSVSYWTEQLPAAVYSVLRLLS